MKHHKRFKGLFVLVVVTLLVAACGKPTPTQPAPPPAPQGQGIEELNKLLVDAVNTGDTAEVERILNAGADPMTMTTLGPLPSFAAMRGNPDILGLLAKGGADLNALDMNGLAPIHIAAGAGNLGAVTKLLDLGIDANSMGAPNMAGPPLFNAIDSGNFEIADLLINRGADVNLLNFESNTPLISAVELGNLDMTNLLISNSADLNLQGMDGLTPLHFAAMNDDLDMFQLLLDSGADFSILNNEGLLPFEMGELDFGQLDLSSFDPSAFDLGDFDLDSLFP